MHDLNVPDSQPAAVLPDLQPLDARDKQRVRAWAEGITDLMPAHQIGHGGVEAGRTP